MTRQFQEWQRLAWAIGAHDIGQDCPTEDEVRNDDTDEPDGWRQLAAWAEGTHGDTAGQFIVMFDALTAMRAEQTAPPQIGQPHDRTHVLAWALASIDTGLERERLDLEWAERTYSVEAGAILAARESATPADPRP